MKLTTSRWVLSIFFLVTAMANATTEQMLYTTEGYPYSNIVSKADLVKLHYSDSIDEEGLACRVEVLMGDRKWESEQARVKHTSFEQDALRACLTRADAKEILAGMYN